VSEDALPASEEAFTLLPEQSAICVGGQTVTVTSTQFRLIAVLVQNPGRIFSRAELVAQAIDAIVEDRTIDVHVKELRRKLGQHGTRIETVRGRGYRYRVEPGQ
jgi:two-component system phosphate regulon response regulator PhoB